MAARLARLVPVAALLVPVLGTGLPRAPQQELVRSYPLDAGATVVVSNRSGRIFIAGWERDSAEVRAVKRSRSGRGLAETVIDVQASRTRLEIHTLHPESASDVEVDYDIKVPLETSIEARSTSGGVSVSGIRRGATLTSTSGDVEAAAVAGTVRAVSTSGSLRLSGVGPAYGRTTSGGITLAHAAGDADLETTSGTIQARGVEGRATLMSLSGRVSVDGAAGPVSARSVSGGVAVSGSAGAVTATSTSATVVVDGAKGRIEATSTSGGVRVTRSSSPEVELRSTSGNIDYGGSVVSGGRYELESFSGGVTLALDPGECGFALEAKTVSGTIETELDLTLPKVERSGRTQHLEGVHGKGCARIRATSFSGNIRVRRGR